MLLVVAFYAAVTAVWTFPQVLHLADAMAPVPDALLHSWILAWDIHALTTDPLHLYDGNIYFPFPLSLTYSDAMLSGALLVSPVLLLTGNAVLAHNVLTLASLLIAAVGMYLLVRALTGSDVGSIVAGCIFAFCASRQAHLEHVNLLQFGWLPLALLCLHKTVQRGRASEVVLFAMFTMLQALASVYLAWMMAVAYALYFAVELVFRRAAWTKATLARVAGALLVAASIVIGLMWPYARMQQLYAFQWPTDVVGDFSATLTDYVSVVPRSILYGHLLGQFASERFPSEHILFPGVSALALAFLALIGRRPNLDVMRYSLIGCVAFVLSFGPTLRLNDRDQSIALPYAFLLQFVPGFAVMRVPSRFDFLLMLALAVMAGFGVARLAASLARWTGPPVRRLLLMVVLAITLLELLPGPEAVVPISVGDGVPPVYGWLRTLDPGAVVAEIPTRGPNGYASYGYEYFSSYHWHPLVNGGSGFEPPAAASIAKQLDAFPDAAAVADLRSLGLRYLIVHRDQLDSSATQRLNEANLTPLQLGISATFGPDVVYELAPSDARPSLRDNVQLELPATIGRGTPPEVSVNIVNDASVPMVVGAPQALGVQIEWNHDGVIQTPRQDLPVFLEPNRRLQLHFPAALGSGLMMADSAQLRVRLTGSVDLEATQNVQILDLPTSLDRNSLAGSLEQVQIPPLARPDSRVRVEMTARNTGPSIWLPDPHGTTGTDGVVGLSVRGWIGPDGSVLPPSPNSTAHVLWNVSPGQSALLALETSAPAVPGHYQIVLDLLSESVTWFEDVQGGARTVVPVDVEP